MKLIEPNDPILWSNCLNVTDIEAQVRPHVSKMRKTLLSHKGLALSAPQVGVPYNFFVLRGPPIEWFINPIWVPGDNSNLVVGREGCLSLPNQYFNIDRWNKIGVGYKDLNGTYHYTVAENLLARIIQHECDHLNGKCIFPRPE